MGVRVPAPLRRAPLPVPPSLAISSRVLNTVLQSAQATVIQGGEHWNERVSCMAYDDLYKLSPTSSSSFKAWSNSSFKACLAPCPHLRLAFSHASHRCARASVPDEERRGLEKELLASAEALGHVTQVTELRVGMAYLCMHMYVYLRFCACTHFIQAYAQRHTYSTSPESHRACPTLALLTPVTSAMASQTAAPPTLRSTPWCAGAIFPVAK